MDETSDEVTFIPENVEPLCFGIIDSVLKDKPYNDLNIQGWIDDICARITKDLVEMNKPFKYLVSCAIMQKNGAGMHSAYSTYWDRQNDNTVVVKWPNEKKRRDPNTSVHCIVTVFGIAY